VAPRAPRLRTARLELRPFGGEDVDELALVFTDPDVRRYLLDDMVVSREWVAGEIAASQARFAESGFGLWRLAEHARDGIVGFVGFRPFFHPPEIQLLYGLLPSHWGRGYATEAAGAAIDYAFDVLGLEEIRAATDAPNSASIAVLTRLGMHERSRSADGARETVFFGVSASEWRGRGRSIVGGR
jgi:RimJ/RimL family protein N-acetyltransferase